jgi:hypothetical protein
MVEKNSDDSEPKFVAPETAKDSHPHIPSFNQLNNKSVAKKSSPISKIVRHWNRLKPWQQIAITIVVLILAGGLAYVGKAVLFKKPIRPAKVAQQENKPAPPKTEEPSRLTGRIVPIEFNKLPVTAVMIENSPDARPQAGLIDAGVVYEAVAEAGITRFLALFQDTKPAYVGPVRSARPYYLRWALPYDAPLAHVGGSPQALQDIQNLPVKDLDQFYNSGTYQRIASRYAPHNVYTGIDPLLALEASKGWTSSNFTSFARKAAAPLKSPTAKTININISSSLYNVTYNYDAASNSYLRSEGGVPHTDDKSGKQISPDVVVVLVTDKGIEADDLHSSYRTTGTGLVFIFQDGGVSVVNWSKGGDKDPLIFSDPSGAVAKLNPGQTWITVIDSTGEVTYGP